MNASVITTRTLEIDGMTGDVCVQKVSDALKDVAGVTTQSVRVGAATIDCDQEACNAACAAITEAGYQAHEGAGASKINGNSGAGAKKTTEQRGGNQFNTPAAAPLPAPKPATPTGSRG